ncbi:MAG: PAS domain S-box protein [Gemmatimonadota bacterium]
MSGPLQSDADEGLILVVDDSEAARYSLRRVLERAGFRVIDASNGPDALLRMSEQPDLLTLEVRMPGLDGYEVCRRVRQNPATSEVPILMISASLTTAEYRVFGLEQGADAYLSHPFQPRELIVSARTLIRLRRARLSALRVAREWQITFDAIEDPMALVDGAGHICRANRAFARISGVSGDDLSGQNVDALLGDGNARGSRAIRLQGRNYQLSERQLEEEQPGTAGFDRLVILREVQPSSVSPSMNGGRDGAASFNRDRTAPAADHDDHGRLLFDSVPARIWFKDAHNRILRVNLTAAAASGHTVAELEGASTYDIYPHEADRFYQDDLAVIRSGEPRRGIIEQITLNGESRWLETDKIPVRAADGQVTGILVFSVDITERHVAEEQVGALANALQTRVAELQTLLDVLPVGIGIADDPSCREIRINAAFARQLGVAGGISASGHITLPHPDFTVTADGKPVDPGELPMPRAAREQRRIENAEFDIVRADGSIVKLLESAAPILDAAGKVRGAVGAFLDITTRHGAEQALRESEAQFREMAENISEVLWMTDPSTNRMLYVSPRYQELFGVAPDGLYQNALGFLDLIHPQDRERILEQWGDGGREDYDAECRIVRPDGELRWIRVHAFALNDGRGALRRFVGIVEDITARKRTEEGERLLAGAGEVLAASLEETDLLGGIAEVAVRSFADEVVLDALGESGRIQRVAWKSGEDRGEQLHPARSYSPQLSNPAHPVARAFDTGEATLVVSVTDEWMKSAAFSEEHLAFMRSLDLASLITVPVIARERQIGAMTFMRRRGRAEPFTTDDLDLVRELARRTALAVDNARLFRESTQMLREHGVTLSLLDTTLASAPIGLGFWDRELRFVRVNHALARLDGLSIEEHLGRTLQEVLPSIATQLEPVIRAVFDTGQPTIDYPVTVSPVSAPEEARHLLESFYPVRGENGRVLWVGVTVVDITDRKRTQDALESLAQSLERQVNERTAALQTRAADLTRSNAELEQFAYVASHDLQEPLRMVANFAQLLARRYRGSLGPDADEFIGYIQDGVERMHALITGLLSYARLGQEDLTPTPVDLGAACEQATLQLAQIISESGAAVSAGKLPTVLGDATHLTQLFQNLISNALKFRGGEPPKIEISAEQGTRAVAVGPSTTGSGWIISVADNGIGVAPEHAQRIFMIFQRLHQRDEYPGTGLGLAIGKKIVENLGGQIWVEPNLPSGSIFRFFLPMSVIVTPNAPASGKSGESNSGRRKASRT